jgi:hypothetical protein
MRGKIALKMVSVLVLTLSAEGVMNCTRASLIQVGQGESYFQDFDSLPSSGKSKFGLPGWAIRQSQGGKQIGADDGSSSSGGIYSYGLDGSQNRALGILTDAKGRTGTFGADFQNAALAPITTLNISYTGEEWRLGVEGQQNTLEFQYSLNAKSLSDPKATWLNVPALSFLTPNLTDVGAHDGTLAINQTQIASTISFLNIPQGATFWVRWQETGVASNTAGDGLAVDNFSLSAVPEVSTLLGAFAALGLLAAAVWHPHSVRARKLLSRP